MIFSPLQILQNVVPGSTQFGQTFAPQTWHLNKPKEYFPQFAQ
jgi:hypothetical protein